MTKYYKGHNNEKQLILMKLKDGFTIITDSAIICPHCHTLRRYMERANLKFKEMDVLEYAKVGGVIKGQPTLMFESKELFWGLPGSYREFILGMKELK